MRWRKVTLIGVGLLGGSLGLALKRRRLAKRVVGYVRREASIRECLAAGAVHEATLNLQQAVSGADLIVLCTPIAQMGPLARLFVPWLKRGAVVTDVGSVKSGVARELERLIARAGGHFIGSHPMAGAERTGVSAAHAKLFGDAVCVVTPTRNSNPRALKKVEALWSSVGARLVRLAPVVHDRLVARSSHLPHILAAALASHVLDPRQSGALAMLCATGFRDTTRIASGSPEMWRDIVLANRGNLRRELAAIAQEIERVRLLLRAGDAVAIQEFLAAAKQRRDEWCASSASPSPE
jgi:prephenate dehydrogenase